MFKLLLVVVVSSVVLSGCINQSNSTTATTDIEQKKGDTVVSGTLIKQGEIYYLSEGVGAQQPVESYAVDLETYVNKQVTITGQYSGDTLFVGKIE